MAKPGRRVFILVTFALILGAWVMTIEAGIVAPRRPVERGRVEWLASYYGASWSDVSIEALETRARPTAQDTSKARFFLAWARVAALKRVERDVAPARHEDAMRFADESSLVAGVVRQVRREKHEQAVLRQRALKR